MLGRFGALRPATQDCHASVALEGGAGGIAPVVRALDEAGLGVASMELVQPTLDDVFVEKTGRHLEGSAEQEPEEQDAAGEPVAAGG